MFLHRLQEDQQDMLELIQEREKARKKGLDEQNLPVLKVPAPAVAWDVGQPPSPLEGVRAVDPQPQMGSPAAQPSTVAPMQTGSPGTCLHATAPFFPAPVPEPVVPINSIIIAFPDTSTINLVWRPIRVQVTSNVPLPLSSPVTCSLMGSQTGLVVVRSGQAGSMMHETILLRQLAGKPKGIAACCVVVCCGKAWRRSSRCM